MSGRPSAAALFFTVGVRRRPSGRLGLLIGSLGLALGAWVIAAAAFIIIQPWTLAVIFLSGMMTLAFVTIGATPRANADRPSPADWLLSAAAAATGIYFTLGAGAIEQRVALLDPLGTWNIVFGSILLLLTLEITRRTTGLGLTLVVLLFVAYNLLGHHLGGLLKHGDIGYLHFLKITVFTTDGVFGLPVRVAATYAFLFVLFGTVLMYARGGNFFFDLAASVSGRRPGQDRGRLLRALWHGFRQSHVGRGHHRVDHDPDHEAPRLSGRPPCSTTSRSMRRCTSGRSSSACSRCRKAKSRDSCQPSWAAGCSSCRWPC